jgi:hypothetical protein
MSNNCFISNVLQPLTSPVYVATDSAVGEWDNIFSNDNGFQCTVAYVDESNRCIGFSSDICLSNEVPSSPPSVRPSAAPSKKPSATPSVRPSAAPSKKPSARPSAAPSKKPSAAPSVRPSAAPSKKPSARPSAAPFKKPSAAPSMTKDDGCGGNFFLKILAIIIKIVTFGKVNICD